MARKAPLKNRPTRERILRAGLHLFQRQGYHATGIVQILDRARATKGSFYHHFPDGKQALASAAVQWLEVEVTNFLDAITANGGGSDEMVLGLARRSAAGLKHPDMLRGSLLTVLAQEAIPGSPSVHHALCKYVGSMRERLVLAHAQEDASPSRAKTFADQALALLQGFSVMARVDSDTHDMERNIQLWLRERTATRKVS